MLNKFNFHKYLHRKKGRLSPLYYAIATIAGYIPVPVAFPNMLFAQVISLQSITVAISLAAAVNPLLSLHDNLLELSSIHKVTTAKVFLSMNPIESAQVKSA
jgi:hypothetical protein